MTQPKKETAGAAKRAASPRASSPSATTKEEPPKKRGRTTRRSMAIQAEEDAQEAAQKGEEIVGHEEEEDREEEDKAHEKKNDSDTKIKKEKKDAGDEGVKVKKEDNEDNDGDTRVKKEDRDDKTTVKKEEEPLHPSPPPQQQQHKVVEKGHVYFFYRPKIDVDHPSGPDDVQKLYMLLSPDAAVGRVSTASKTTEPSSTSTSSSSTADADEDKKTKTADATGTGAGKAALHRLLIVPRKALPVYEPRGPGSGGGGRANIPGSRNWAFVDTASPDLEAVENRLFEYTYSTKTRGERTQGSARLIAEARYEVIVENIDVQYPSRQTSHFVYELQVPLEPGPVQKAFKIDKEGQFMIHVKNPQIQSPATAKGAVRYATLKDKAAQLPAHLQSKFRGIRKEEVRYTALDTGEFLDVPHVELVLLAVRKDAREEFEELLKELEEEVEEEIKSEIETEDKPVDRTYKDLKVDEATIPDAIDEFK
ncbi:hypothetical protein BGX29_005637 [Mortierella sp. GBA35]|nr:hypothetical protein BGX29_005637 [Mortierella sp. GBA35]